MLYNTTVTWTHVVFEDCLIKYYKIFEFCREVGFTNYSIRHANVLHFYVLIWEKWHKYVFTFIFQTNTVSNFVSITVLISHRHPGNLLGGSYYSRLEYHVYIQYLR